MTKEREALKMALEALERYETKRQDDRFAELITAIKEALTQLEPTPEQLAALGWQSIECPFCGTSGARAFPKPEQEPVGLDKYTLRDMAGAAFETAMAFGISTDSFERLARDVNKRIVAALAQPEQEPFNPDWVSYRQGKLDGAAESLEETKRKEWVGLTGGDMDDITSTAMDKADAMLLTEVKLKELNDHRTN